MKRFNFNNETFKYYNPSEIDAILENVSRETKTKNKIKYYNSANAFDIETTSTIINGDKRAFMYMWSFAIENCVIIGRTWNEFINTLNVISKRLVTYNKRRFVIYVHNLPYEFQFIRKWFEWEKVFSLDNRKPINAVTTNGIEFRCSLALSGYALENLPNVKHKKLVGALNYDLVRHSKTELKNSDIAYSIRDVECVVDYISNKIEMGEDITKIPLTKTGYVRLECRQSCYGVNHRDTRYNEYRDLMNHLTLEPQEYFLLKESFQGGFTHGNPYLIRKCERGKDGAHYISNVGSFDITSSYPTEMIAENQFPMSKGVFINGVGESNIYTLSRDYFLILDIEFDNLQDNIFIDNPLSKSRCTYISPDARINNGRVVSAKKCRTTITSIDFEIFRACYLWSGLTIHTCIKYLKGYLPTPFITKVLDFYKAKTKLKGVEGAEIEYMWGKENVNATFGCTVTDPCQPVITYTGDDITPYIGEPLNIEKAIDKYNKNKNRFLFYPWGVAITALARRRLWGLILACGDDYCYADTDSVKVRNPEKYEKYFKKSDDIITEKLKRAIKFHGLKWEDVAPLNKFGESKQLGLWELEGIYKRFRMNGAKRYLYQTQDNKISLTVSGLNKKKAIPYLSERAENNIDKIFEMFTEGLEIPSPYSGRMVSTYIDEETNGAITDYNGVVSEFHELSSVHLAGTSYTMDYAREFERYQSYIELMFGISTENIIIERSLDIE